MDAHRPDKPALAATPADRELTRGPRFVRLVTLLLVLAAFAGPGAGPLFARDGQSQSTAAPSTSCRVPGTLFGQSSQLIGPAVSEEMML